MKIASLNQITLSCVIALCSATAAHALPHLSEQQHQVLYVISAADGTINKQNQNYQLTLQHVEPDSLWFTNHPARNAGFIPTTQLTDHWRSDFHDSSPNAALVHVGVKSRVNGKSIPMAMELTHPVYHKDHSITFTATALAGDHIQTGNYQDMSLFIDDGFHNCPISFHWCIPT